MDAAVVAVHRRSDHAFSKDTVPAIELVAGHGVRDDAHGGSTVRHRSRVAKDPTQPNLRQVHLLHAELFDNLRERGFAIEAGQLGENITTRGVDLLGLSVGALLRIGSDVVIRVTGLRNPCQQLDDFRPGLLAAVLDRSADGTIIRKIGIMGTVQQSGAVRAGDRIVVSESTCRAPLQVV